MFKKKKRTREDIKSVFAHALFAITLTFTFVRRSAVEVRGGRKTRV